MKIKPVIDGLEAAGVTTTLIHTGQHYDQAMSAVFFDELGIRQPDHHLGAGSGSHAEQTAKVLVSFERLLSELRPDAVVVVGDVNSTLACAVVGAKAGSVVAHVEAGLRSRDWAMPEEINRVVTDRVSDLLLAPSPDAVDNLRAEGYRPDQIHLVGNVMIDTLLANIDRARSREVWRRLDIPQGGYGVVTLHRPSNVDDPAVLSEILASLEAVAEKLPLVFPVHPRTRKTVCAHLARDSRLTLLEPLGYLDFIGLIADSAVVLTDSGGIQEETTVLGIPCLTMRENTERPITITEGTNQLVGRRLDKIMSALDTALSNNFPRRRPYLWDGRAGSRIAAVIHAAYTNPPGRPTELTSETT